MLFAPGRQIPAALRAAKRVAKRVAVIAALLGWPALGWAQDQAMSAKAPDPAATVKLLTAPHTGKNICDIPDATPLRFLKYARHGPHKFARVEVLEGGCAGKQGFVALQSVDRPTQ